MEYKNYRFETADIENQIAISTKNLKANMSRSDLKGYAVGVINKRLMKDPKRYLDYGMYWGELKEVLRRHGYDWGETVVSPISEVYKGENDLQTVIMADAFRNYYLDNFAIGTNSFVLNDDDPEFTVFIDESMENLAQQQ